MLSVIYIVKLVNKNGEEVLLHTEPMEKTEVVRREDLSKKSYRLIESTIFSPEWADASIEIMKGIPDLSYLPMEKFMTMLEDVVKQKRFRYINGRFHVDSYFSSRNIVFIAFLHLIQEDKWKALTSGNILCTLYKDFRNKNHMIGKSAAEYGRDNIEVFLYGPYPNGKGLYDRLLEICDEHGCSISQVDHRVPRNLFGGKFAEKLLNKANWDTKEDLKKAGLDF